VRGVTPIAGRAGVEKENPLPDVICRAVAVAVDDAVDVFELPPEPLLEPDGRTPPVNEADPEAADFDNPLVGKTHAEVRGVHVAADGDDVLVPEGVEHCGIDEVACVQDHAGVAEVFSDDGAEPVVGLPKMRVGDDADLQT